MTREALASFFAEVSVISRRMTLKPQEDVYSALRSAAIRNRVEPTEELLEWAAQISKGTGVHPKLG